MSASLDTSGTAFLPAIDQVSAALMRGSRLEQLVAMDGWKDIEEMLNVRIEAAENLQRNMMTSDKDIIAAMQFRVKAMRDLYHGLGIDIDSAINLAKTIAEQSRAGLASGEEVE